MSTQSSAGNPPRLTVAMIVRDAEEVLEATLRQIAPIADEIVVVDTGSSDRTRQLALKFPEVSVRDFTWCDDFSAARNFAQQQATGDWIFWIDAGELISSAEAEQLREFVDKTANPANAYAMLIRVPRAPDSIAGEQAARVRLVPNQPGISWRGRVRENLSESLASAGKIVEGLPYRLERSDRDHRTSEKVRKARRNLQLAQLQIQEEGPTPAMLNCLGDAMQTLGDSGGAARCFRQSVQLGDADTIDVLEAYYGLLTALDQEADARDAQLSICLQALQAYPLDAQLLCAMGGYLQGQGRLDLAARSYQTAYQFGQVQPATWHLDEVSEVAAVCYSLTLQFENRDDEARQVLQQALDNSPHSTRLVRQLLDLDVKHGRRDEALEMVRLLPEDTPHREALRSAVRGACMAAAKNWISALAYLQAAYDDGCRDAICLRWLCVALLAGGKDAAAADVVAEWQTLDPHNIEANQYRQLLAHRDQPESSAHHEPHLRFSQTSFPADLARHSTAPAKSRS